MVRRGIQEIQLFSKGRVLLLLEGEVLVSSLEALNIYNVVHLD